MSQAVVSPTTANTAAIRGRKQGNLVVQRGGECNFARFDRRGCPFCSRCKWDWHPSAVGVIYSTRSDAGRASRVLRLDPVPDRAVELDEQRKGRVATPARTSTSRCASWPTRQGRRPHRAEDEDNVAIGKRVEVCFLDVDDDTRCRSSVSVRAARTHAVEGAGQDSADFSASARTPRCRASVIRRWCRHGARTRLDRARRRA